MKEIYLFIYISLFCSIFSVIAHAQTNDKFYQGKVKKSNFRTTDSVYYIANSCLIKLKKETKYLFKESGIELLKKSIPLGINFIGVERIFQGEAAARGDFDRELYYLVKYESELNLEEVLLKINSLPFIEIAEPYKKNDKFSIAPNDPLADTIDPSAYPHQWQLKNINAYKAFEIEKGDTNVVTGISDLGTEYTHPDLINNIKLNKADPIDGADNDNDGYIDNYYGWDVGVNDNNPRPDPGGWGFQHGTLVTGCGFMTPNNSIGGAGTGYNCKYVPIKISGVNSGIISGYQSIDYAVLKKMQIINLSWGGQGAYSQIEQDIINYAVANDVMVIAAGGNAVADVIYYPAGYDNVLAVAATSDTDTLGTTWSNIIDICAPGVNVATTYGNTYYELDYGSSVAAPTVAGAAALVRSHFPQYSGIQAAEQLRVTADIIDTIPKNRPFKGKIGLGRLNMYRALTETNAVSVRSTKNVLRSSLGNNNVVIGDVAQLQGRFVNYLSPSTAVKVKLTSKSPYITFIDSVFMLPSLGMMDSVKNTASPFTFSLNANAPFNFAIDFTYRFDYGQGFIDYQNFRIGGLNPDFLDLDTNLVTASITNTGRIGYVNPGTDGTAGSGFTYEGYNLQYMMGIMVSTHGNKLSNCLGGAAAGLDNDFTPLRNSQYADVPFAHEYITTTLTENNTNKIGVTINQRSYEVKGNSLDKTVFFEYRIKNTNPTALDSLNFTLYNDWDIPYLDTSDPNYYTRNRCGWDATNKMSYAYSTYVNSFYAGTVLLTDDKPVYYALDNTAGPTNLYDGFSDTEKYLISSNGTSKSNSGFNKTKGTDVSENIGYTLFNLAPGETRVVAFAVMAGDNLSDLQSSAFAAKNTYRALKTSPEPVLALNNKICKNTSIVINPANVDSITVYQKAGGSAIYKGMNYVSNPLYIDTIFYVTGNDSLFESAPVTANYLVQTPSSAFTANSDNIVSRQFNFSSTSNTGIDTWNWNYGDNTNGNGAAVSHLYGADGIYQVVLVVTDATGCSDISSSNVTVTSVVTDILHDQLSGSVLKVFPNPANENLYFSYHENVTVEIFDLLGRLVTSVELIGKGDESVSDISIENLRTGSYVVKAVTSGRQELIKLVVTH